MQESDVRMFGRAFREAVAESDRPGREESTRHERANRCVRRPGDRTSHEVTRPQEVQRQPMSFGVDQLHQERPISNHPRVGIGLALGDDLPLGVDIEHEGEWVLGHGHHATTPSCRRP